MLTLRHDPFCSLGDLRSEMDRLFGGVPIVERPGRTVPPVNAWEHEGVLFVEAELPGFTMENLDIALTGRELTIKGRHEESEPEGATVHRRERPFGEFVRTIHLPFDVEGEEVQANLRHGVLTIRLPRSKADLPRKIKVVSE
jgi:HSP20 family protein